MFQKQTKPDDKPGSQKKPVPTKPTTPQKPNKPTGDKPGNKPPKR